MRSRARSSGPPSAPTMSGADPAHISGARATGTPHGMTELSEAECRALLRRQRLCVIAMVDGEEPYAVPVYYGFDGETIFIGVMEGRKSRVLDRNRHVTITVTEIAPDGHWQSVIAAGVARVLTDPAARDYATGVLVAHNARVGLHEGTRRKHTGGRLICVDRMRLTGRARV